MLQNLCFVLEDLLKAIGEWALVTLRDTVIHPSLVTLSKSLLSKNLDNFTDHSDLGLLKIVAKFQGKFKDDFE